MSQVIRVSDELYHRLEALAEGFDTPNAVIQRLLVFYESAGEDKPIVQVAPSGLTTVPSRLDIIFSPPSEEKFKRELLKHRKAYVKLYKTDGSIESKSWDARKITSSSSVMGNLRSGLLRGWKSKGIFKAEVFIGTE